MKKFEKKQPLSREHDAIDLSPQQNEYYEAISERCGLVQVFLYLILLAFVAVSFLMNTDLITYQNLYYFAKDLNSATETVDVLHTDSISYPTDTSQSFALYRQGLAVAGNTSVTIFTATGRQTVSRNVQYQNPVAVGTGKYLLVYELDGTSYSLYNSYTQIHAGKTDSPIRCATMSSSGMYAIVTESEEYASVVRLYSRNFELVNQYRYNGYVTDVAINGKGSYLSVLISRMENGAFSTSLNVYEPKKDTIHSQVEIGTGLGLRCGFTDSDVVTVLSGNGVYSVSVGGKLISEYHFEGKNIKAFDLSDDGCAIVLKNNRGLGDQQVILFDKKGKIMHQTVVDQTIRSVASNQGNAYLVCSDGLLRIQGKDGSQRFVECMTEGRVLLVTNDGRAMLCSAQKATYENFES